MVLAWDTLGGAERMTSVLEGGGAERSRGEVAWSSQLESEMAFVRRAEAAHCSARTLDRRDMHGEAPAPGRSRPPPPRTHLTGAGVAGVGVCWRVRERLRSNPRETLGPPKETEVDHTTLMRASSYLSIQFRYHVQRNNDI